MNTQILRSSLRQQWRDYLELTKPKVVALIAFTAMVGMFLDPRHGSVGSADLRFTRYNPGCGRRRGD